MKTVSLSVLFLSAALLPGCATKITQVDENELTPLSTSIVKGHSVDVRALGQIYRWNKKARQEMITVGSKPNSPDEVDLVPYDPNRELLSNWLFQDVELSYGTKEMFASMKPTLERGVIAGGGTLARGRDADYVLLAELTFGPNPAPVYNVVNLGKHVARQLMTLGLATRAPFEIRADYALDLRLIDEDSGETIKEQAYRVDKVYGGNDVNQLDFKGQEKTRKALRQAFVDGVEGHIQDFLKHRAP